MNRRTFVTVAGLGAVGGPALLKAAEAPQVLSRKNSRPVVIAAANGNVSKDAAGLTCVAKAFKMITAGQDVPLPANSRFGSPFALTVSPARR